VAPARPRSHGQIGTSDTGGPGWVRILQKPFTTDVILRAMRETIDQAEDVVSI